MKNKSQNKISILFFTIFIILAGFVFFAQTEKAFAADSCVCKYPTAGASPSEPMNLANAQCQKYCNDYFGGFGALFSLNGSPFQQVDGGVVRSVVTPADEQVAAEANEEQSHGTAASNEAYRGEGEICPGNIWSVGLKFIITCPLSVVQSFNGMLLGMAAALFGVVVDADRLKAVIANPALYTAWSQVRDVLNIAFILFLLYSAFSIIFQVGGKYGEKKIILTIVLMALLVNFSFPIARFIIDASNSLMYTLLNQLMPTAANNPNSLLTGITQGSAMKVIMTTTADASVSQLLASVIFSFILAMTFLALAVMFLIRMVALAILIIFSPVAFVGNIAGKDFGWWDMLFKYAFFGPIMILALIISIDIMEAIGTSVNLAKDNDIISAMANMAIPITILWMSMGIAQKMGIEGAGQVMGLAQKAAAGAGKKVSGFNFANNAWKDYKKERDARHEEARFKPGKWLGNKANDLQDSFYAELGSTKAQKRFDKRKDTKNKEDVKSESEKHEGTTEHVLHAAIKDIDERTLNGMKDSEITAAAGQAKQALSRGAKYEKEIERDLKTKAAGHIGLSGIAKPIAVTNAVITGNPITDALEKDREKREKKAMDDWIQEEKSAAIDRARSIISKAEDISKIKPRTRP